ncbi:methyltransferase [Streptomyces caniferus]|uniref:methyltransferase n=1 Tax=Streptomyces caniferus TaxID=285557 RepID=UPI00371C5033
MGVTAVLLRQLGLLPGQRMLDIGTGAGVTAATACHVCGDAGVVTLDRDPHVVAAARDRLAALGYAPTVVGPGNCPHRAPQRQLGARARPSRG